MDERARRLSGPFANFMRNPDPSDARTCDVCLGFIDAEYQTCYRCGRINKNSLATVVPITYAIRFGQMHDHLHLYKNSRSRSARDSATVGLGSVLWRFLDAHERCVASAAGVNQFDIVTIVPPTKQEVSGEPRDRLAQIVGRICEPTRGRFQEVITRSDLTLKDHEFDERKFIALRELQGENVLLIDDMWTTGASAQAAACALLAAGANQVALVVLGRFVKDFKDHRDLFSKLPATFDWDTCAAEVPLDLI